MNKKVKMIRISDDAHRVAKMAAMDKTISLEYYVSNLILKAFKDKKKGEPNE